MKELNLILLQANQSGKSLAFEINSLFPNDHNLYGVIVRFFIDFKKMDCYTIIVALGHCSMV